MNTWLFALMTFGITLVVAFMVAAMIKLIAVVVQKEKKGAAIAKESVKGR